MPLFHMRIFLVQFYCLPSSNKIGLSHEYQYLFILFTTECSNFTIALGMKQVPSNNVIGKLINMSSPDLDYDLFIYRSQC